MIPPLSKVYRLDEKDTPSKLEILFKQNLYVLAINLAHMQKYDDASIVEIFKKYGDHLYIKGDYDGAMEQYLRTIGKLEPSYVIRKVRHGKCSLKRLSMWDIFHSSLSVFSFWMPSGYSTLRHIFRSCIREDSPMQIIPRYYSIAIQN
jgi:hypothetical protein